MGATLFPGDKDEKQLALIFDICGTPNSQNYEKYWDVKPEIREHFEKKPWPNILLEKLKEKDWQGKMSNSLLDLI